MIEREVCGLVMARSQRSVGSPERQTMRVLRRFGTFCGDLVLHLDLVLVGHDDDARPAARLVGDGELGDDVEDRGATS